MPRLPNDIAKQASNAAQGGFTPLDPGKYHARLTGVEAKVASTGNPMWVWAFEVSRGPRAGAKQWVNTVLVDTAMWKLGQVFDAFGVGTDTDTDELIGHEVILEVSQRTIGAGARSGQVGNNVDNVLPLSGSGGADTVTTTTATKTAATIPADAGF